MRKHEAIDLMNLYANGHHKKWNVMLSECVRSGSINRLARVRYELQAGMDDLVTKKLNTEDMSIFYLRLMRSVEKTAKKIIHDKIPMPGDDPNLKNKVSAMSKLEAKRQRDRELQKFLSKNSY
jgi:hypothetical protein